MQEWLDPKSIAAMLMGLGMIGGFFGFGLPNAQRADANRDANFIARDAWNACEEEKDAIVIQRDALWERLLQQRAERGVDDAEGTGAESVPYTLFDELEFMMEAESGSDQ